MSPNATGRFDDGRAVRKKHVVAKQSEMRHLPIFHRSIAKGDPAIADSHRIIWIKILFTLYLVDRYRKSIDNAMCRGDIVIKKEVSVFDEVACPGAQIKFYVKRVIKEFL